MYCELKINPLPLGGMETKFYQHVTGFVSLLHTYAVSQPCLSCPHVASDMFTMLYQKIFIESDLKAKYNERP